MFLSSVLRRLVKKREVAVVCKITEVLLQGGVGRRQRRFLGSALPLQVPACEPEGSCLRGARSGRGQCGGSCWKRVSGSLCRCVTSVSKAGL